MSKRIKYITSNSNNSSSVRSGTSSSNSSSKESGSGENNNFAYESNNNNLQAAIQASLFESRAPRPENVESKSSNNTNSNNDDNVEPTFENDEYFMTEDVDYVRINVKGDGSCLYRSIYVAAFMYPIERDIIKGLLLPEFESVDSILGLVLGAFGYTADELPTEEEAVTFMRKKLSEGILGTHHDPTINDVCDYAITEFYTNVISHLCQAFNSDISKVKKQLITSNNNNLGLLPTAYQAIVEVLNSQLATFFTKTPVAQLTLQNFRETVAKTILSKSTYASQLDFAMIQDILARKNIILKSTSLNKFNPDQKFPIIENHKPILIVDNIGEIHYNALVPKVEYYDYASTSLNGRKTLENSVSRGPSTQIIKKNKNGKNITVEKIGDPIIFSRRTFANRQSKGLKGGRKTLKSRRRK